MVFLPFQRVLSQTPADYLNQNLKIEDRVADLVKRLSLNQKIKLLMYQGLAIDSNGVKVPAYNWWNECLHGVARAGKATVFPQAISIAATWDTLQVYNIADAISDEARAKYDYFSEKAERGIYHGLNFWTPNINIFRDPRWGRGMETYGEDPFLTGKIADSFIRGLQGNDPNYFKAIATVKHFVVHSGPERSRHRFNANVSDRDLYETYTPAFKTAIKDAHVYSVMCAYNSFRGQPCCGSGFLLNDLLRRQWGFNGFIVTDCGAINDFYKPGTHEVVQTPEEASAMAIKSGVDAECGEVFNALNKAIAKKLLTEADLDHALKRLFTARFKLGFFDDADKVKYKNIPYSTVESASHIQLSLESARRSMVLLNNKGTFLPLSKKIGTIAVIGPNANDTEVLLANYHGYPAHIVTPLEGIRNKLPNTKILYAKGSPVVQGLPILTPISTLFLFSDQTLKEHGLKADYFNNNELRGSPVIQRTDSLVDFDWINYGLKELNTESFSAKWSGYLQAPSSGKYVLDVYGGSDYRLFINDSLIVTFNSPHGCEHVNSTYNFEKGKSYAVRILYKNTGSSPQLKLSWQIPGQELSLKEEAIRIAQQSDVVVMCMGLSPLIEGEEMKIKLDGFDGGDRTKLKLPDVQEELIKQIAALGKPVVLVLLNGSAIAINWESEHVPAILEAWYGGEQAGNAIADVLFGDYNPAGRLPVTFYRSERDLPDFENYDMKGRTYRYFKGKPLYEFGFGLSYTKFKYDQLSVKKISAIDKPLKVWVSVQNVGGRPGDEVVQLYLKNLTPNQGAPIHTLKGFLRVNLRKQETKKIFFTLYPKDFSVVDSHGKIVTRAGRYQIYVGGQQPNHNVKLNPGCLATIKLTGKEQRID